MTATHDFDRLVGSWLEGRGPDDLSAHTLTAALATARMRPQRRGARATLAGTRPWPAPKSRIGTASRPILAVAVVALLALALVGLAVLASRLIDPKPDILRGFDGVVDPLVQLNADTVEPTLVGLDDGRVLVVDDSDGSAVVLDPASRTVTPIGSAPEAPVQAKRLPDGRVLLVGWIYADAPAEGRPDVRVFDPKTGSVMAAGAMVDPRFEPTIIPLRDGRVLVGGGVMSPEGGQVGTVEMLDLATMTFTSAGWSDGALPLRAVGTELGDGRIAIAGGCWLTADQDCDYDLSVTVRDVRTGVAQASATQTHARVIQGLIPLRDGRLMLFERWSRGDRPSHLGRHGIDPVSVDLFDPRTGAISAGVPLPHVAAVVAPLPDGRVFMAGKWDVADYAYGPYQGANDAWVGLYDPATGESITTMDPTGAGSPFLTGLDLPFTAGAALPDGRVVLSFSQTFAIFH